MERYKSYFLFLVCFSLGILTTNYTYSALKESEEATKVESEEKKLVEVASAEEEVSEEAGEEVAPEEEEEISTEEEAVGDGPKETGEEVAPESGEEAEKEVVGKEAVSQEEEEVGPDTVTLSEEKIGFRGNWVKKREWLLRAKDQNDKIQTLASEVKKRQPSFREKFNKIQSELDQFYRRVGRTEGKLELIKRVLDQQEKEQAFPAKKPTAIKEDPWYKRLLSTFLGITDWIYDNIAGWFVGKKEEPKKDAVEAKEKLPSVKDKAPDVMFKPNELELLGKDVKTVKDLDDALVKRIDKLAEQISLVNEEASRSKGLLDEIWDMIDDAKAQANFYALKTVTKRIKSIKDYIEGDFAFDFDATIETIKKEMGRINERIGALEGAGFIAKDEGFSSPSKKIDPEGAEADMRERIYKKMAAQGVSKDSFDNLEFDKKEESLKAVEIQIRNEIKEKYNDPEEKFELTQEFLWVLKKVIKDFLDREK